MKQKLYVLALTSLLCLCISSSLQAQLTFSAQLRTRTELRNGQGTPQVRDTASALFTSQRSRLSIGYAGYRIKTNLSLQDVRVWGQDASSINRITTDAFDGLLLHEAWADISLVDTGKVVKNFSLKIGRQELVYDDVRLLGNLDWLQQARRHDAAVLKFDHKGWTAHIAAAYNQNAERKSNTIYNGVPTGYAAGTNGLSASYKSMQFVYLAKKLYFGNTSFLFFKDDFSKFHFAPNDTQNRTPIYDQGVWSRYTMGGNLFGTAFRKLGIAASAFYQTGKYRDGTKLNEYLLSLSTMYSLGRKLTVGPGVDLTSGNNGSDPSKKYARFDPLYGTPHKFWGYMDYFYVADGFGSNGLVDYYLKAKHKTKDNLTLSLDAHRFVLPNAIMDENGEPLTKSLSTEIDLVASYAMTKLINIEGGFSAMFSTSTMNHSKVKNTPRGSDHSTWAYLMISIKPEFIVK